MKPRVRKGEEEATDLFCGALSPSSKKPASCNYNNDSFLAFPTTRIKGNLSASPYAELEGETFVQGSYDSVSHVKHEGKWFYGRINSSTATHSGSRAGGKAIFETKCQWSGELVF